MHRFTDPILFLALFLLDALAWLVIEATAGIAATQEGLTPMTVAVAIVIAAPALLFAFVVGLARALANLEPRRFYAWAAGAALVGTLIFGLASPITQGQGIEVGFSYSVWFMGLLALAFVIAFIVAVTGGIPAPGSAKGQDETPGRSKKRTRKQPVQAAPAPRPAGDLQAIPPVRPVRPENDRPKKGTGDADGAPSSGAAKR